MKCSGSATEEVQGMWMRRGGSGSGSGAPSIHMLRKLSCTIVLVLGAYASRAAMPVVTVSAYWYYSGYYGC
jgi:hypothetical protein